jgi:hypothetical protein
MPKEALSITAEAFEILTPIVLFFWFLHTRKQHAKESLFKELIGFYGGWVSNTTNQSDEQNRFEGGLMLQIFDIDENGYFRGEFEYYEKQIQFQNSLPGFTARIVSASLKFYYGKLKFKWNYKLAKPNPLLYSTNRTYIGELKVIDRLDKISEDESSRLEAVYNFKYFREACVLNLIQKGLLKKDVRLPSRFTLMKKSPHQLDPYTNIDNTFKAPYYRREI